jgi:hypothetical protein
MLLALAGALKKNLLLHVQFSLFVVMLKPLRVSDAITTIQYTFIALFNISGSLLPLSYRFARLSLVTARLHSSFSTQPCSRL